MDARTGGEGKKGFPHYNPSQRTVGRGVFSSVHSTGGRRRSMCTSGRIREGGGHTESEEFAIGKREEEDMRQTNSLDKEVLRPSGGLTFQDGSYNGPGQNRVRRNWGEGGVEQKNLSEVQGGHYPSAVKTKPTTPPQTPPQKKNQPPPKKTPRKKKNPPQKKKNRNIKW